MFDWSLEKKNIGGTSAPKKKKEEKLDELFSFETQESKKEVAAVPLTDTDSEQNTNKKPKRQLKKKVEKISPKAPPFSEKKEEKLKLLPTEIREEKGTVNKDNIYYSLSENWDYSGIIQMLNDIDTSSIFQKKPVVEKGKRRTDDELLSQLIKDKFPLHSGREHFDTALNSSSSPYANTFAAVMPTHPELIVDDFGDRSLWELQLNNSNLPGMQLEEFHLKTHDAKYRNELRRGYKRARRDFLKLISYNNTQDLYAAGLSDVDIAMLRKGRACENFNVHRKVPYEYGGTNDFSNLMLIQTHPYHDNLHKFLDMQIFIHPLGAKVKRLFIPVYEGKVYLPYLDINTPGGKSKHDRSVFAGYDKETLDLIAQKTSIGKAAEL